jgi:hypothetical protein
VIAEGPANVVLSDPSVMAAFLGEADLSEAETGTAVK